MFKQIKELNIFEDARPLVIGVSENGIPNEFQTTIDRLKNVKKDFFKLGTITDVYPEKGIVSPHLIFVGLGSNETYEFKDIQTIFSRLYKKVDEDTVILLDTFKQLQPNVIELVERVVETIGLVQYQFKGYKTDQDDCELKDVYLYTKEAIEGAIESGIICAEATNHARSLVNEPRNMLTPTQLANYARNLAEQLDVSYKIYDKKEIEALGMGAFLAVNQGSKEEPRLIHLMYRNNTNISEITTLVGKGITYDSGGYSIKSKTGMVGMKGDMGGAAAVLGAIEIIARKKLPVNVDVVIASTDNLISSEAFVPDDVIVSMSGKTIEILNTDAEGRLTLIDAVTFAKTKDAQRIVDVATLTGGVITALGVDITGGFTNNQEFYQELERASKLAGEDLWQLPVDPFREKCRKSNVADYNNSPGSQGHASFAAAMIAEFVGETPWVHLDIAGTSNKSSDHLLGPEGGTGVMVRSLAKLFEV